MALLQRRSVLAAGPLAALLSARLVRAAGLPDLAQGLKPVNPPEPAPDSGFLTADGIRHSLTEFRGHGMVINFWATWCAPCVAEMPALAALSKAVAPNDIAVMPLSSDRGGADVVSKWFAAHEVSGLPVLLDPKGEAARAFGSRGIPTTVIVDRKGQIRARLEGAADWGNPDVATLVKALVGG